MCVEPEDVVDGECTGDGCCQTSIPAGVNNVTVKVDSFYQHKYVYKFNPCNVAFLVAKDAFTFNKKYLSRDMEYYKDLEQPVIFSWTIGRDNCSVVKASRNYLCKQNTNCIDPEHELGYRCNCKPGYSGNPYLPRGCSGTNKLFVSPISLHSSTYQMLSFVLFNLFLLNLT